MTEQCTLNNEDKSGVDVISSEISSLQFYNDGTAVLRYGFVEDSAFFEVPDEVNIEGIEAALAVHSNWLSRQSVNNSTVSNMLADDALEFTTGVGLSPDEIMEMGRRFYSGQPAAGYVADEKVGRIVCECEPDFLENVGNINPDLPDMILEAKDRHCPSFSF